MKRSALRVAVAAALTATAVNVAPVHAGPVDGWVVIDAGHISGTGTDATELVLAVVDLALKAGKDKVCNPKTKDITPGSLSWRLWQNEASAAIAFEWIGPGSALVSDDCAESLDLTVEVTDYAPGGRPTAAQGNPGRGNDGNPSGGELRAAAEGDNFVVYYDPTALYVRGNSVVEIRVSARYYDKKAKAMLPLGCRMTHTSITPYPTGPQGTTGPVEECA